MAPTKVSIRDRGLLVNGAVLVLVFAAFVASSATHPAFSQWRHALGAGMRGLGF